ncbi:MAG: glycosyltransferase family 61 protein [Rubrivivax sp.]|nr:MAG: glycosyltransferase family 61 protein [Rubrivivax sp.]
MKNSAPVISTTNGRDEAVKPAHYTIEPLRISLLTRKLLRSKKLTRLFILSRRRVVQMTSTADLPPDAVAGKVTLLNSERVNEEIPLFSNADQAEKIAPRLGYIFPPIQIFKIKNAKVFGGSNRFLLRNQLVSHELFNLKTDLTLEELHRTLKFDVAQASARKTLTDPHPVRFAQAACFTDAASSNYAHWITEILVRIFLFQTHSSSAEIPLIVDDGLHSNMMRSLDVVVSPQSQIHHLPTNREADIDVLHHTSVAGYIRIEPREEPTPAHGKFSFSAIRGMVAHIKDRLGVRERSGVRRKIYAKRNSSYRNLVNAKAVESLLIAAGFEIIEPEKMTFDEQVDAFHSASVVVGPTGAAMANIVFCQADCQVFILISNHPEMPYLYWQNLASTGGLKVNYVLGECSPSLRQDLHTDFHIPLEALRVLDNLKESA